MSYRKSSLIFFFAAMTMWFTPAIQAYHADLNGDGRITRADAHPATESGGSENITTFTRLTIREADTQVTAQSSTCGDFDVRVATRPGQTIDDCSYTNDSGDTSACTATIDMIGSCWVQQSCTARGRNSSRESTGECPVLDGTTNVSGFAGTLVITCTEDPSVCGSTGTVTETIGGNASLTDDTLCGQAYGNEGGGGLSRGVWGLIEETFTGNTTCSGFPSNVETSYRYLFESAMAALTDRVMVASAGGIIIAAKPPKAKGGSWSTTQSDEKSATCNPFPVEGPGSCKDSGGLWIAVNGVDLEEEGIDIAEVLEDISTLRCGSDGPPSQCRERDADNDGIPDLECRCPTCDPETGDFLTNESSYTLKQTVGAPKWTGICGVGSPGGGG